MAPFHVPCEPKPEAIAEHMPKHTTLNLLPGGRFPARTRKAQLLRCRNRRPLASQFRAFAPDTDGSVAEQVYHKSVNSALGSRKRNGCQSGADAVHVAVPPFLRTPEGGGFLEVSL